MFPFTPHTTLRLDFGSGGSSLWLSTIYSNKGDDNNGDKVEQTITLILSPDLVAAQVANCN